MSKPVCRDCGKDKDDCCTCAWQCAGCDQPYEHCWCDDDGYEFDEYEE